MEQALKQALKKTLFLYAKSKSVSFALQYLILNKISKSIIGFKTPPFLEDKNLIETLNEELDRLLKADIDRISKNYYPASVLLPKSPLKNARTLPKVILDLYQVGKRRTEHRTAEFNSISEEDLHELPRYYRRNFHFQTDGYLSERSAEAYEYQVDLLFSGTSDAMRRLIIAPMKKHFDRSTGEGLRFLELAAGTGRATQFVKMAFPKARILAVDLSDPYLKLARKNLSAYSKVDFMQADAGKLPFLEGEFDAVYSVFLFHELPLKIRNDVLKESHRVLITGGFLGFVDSIQKGDLPSMDDFLDEFPKFFHEPFYRNYVESPMEEQFRMISNAPYQSERGLFSKVGYIRKKD